MQNNVKKILKTAVFSVFFIFIIVYAFFRSYNLIFGIKIKNVTINGNEIKESAKIENEVLKITGNAKNALNLTLNGREISIDQKGNFDETIILLSGYNIVNIEAVDKFGNKDEKNYQLIFKEEVAP